MSNDTDQLSRALRDHSEQMAGRSLDLGDVKGRARSIRRRRQAGAGAVAAVVLAVAAPVAITVTDAFDAQPVPPADRTETPDPNPDRTDQAQPEPVFPAEPVVLTTEGLPDGKPTTVPYIDYGANQLVTPEGTVDLPGQTAMAAPYGDGWITIGGEGPLVRWTDADGDPIRSEPAASSLLAVSDDGSQVAWVEGRFGDPQVELVAAPTSGGEERSWMIEPGDGEVRPVGFLGEDRPVFTVVETSVNAIAEPDGSLTELGVFNWVSDASTANGLVAGQTSYGVQKSCYGVMDPDASTTETLWGTCDHRLGSFSPDGSYVFGIDPEADGMGSPSAAVLDARTGEVLVRFEPDRNDQLVLSQLAWEDDDSLVAVTVDGIEGLMLRLGLEGTVEAVGPTGSTANMSLPFRFAQVAP